jgi:hypothetical protein
VLSLQSQRPFVLSIVGYREASLRVALAAVISAPLPQPSASSRRPPPSASGAGKPHPLGPKTASVFNRPPHSAR